jgi:hypothetical protein
MRYGNRLMFSAMLLFVIAASAAELGAPKTKKFLTKPLVIEDQGSFFIGGVPKVTNYATVAAPGTPSQAPAPSQITIGQMYGDHGAWIESYRGVPGVDAGWTRRLVPVFRTQRHLHVSRRSGGTRALRV